jgi:hypothetical protein
MSLFSNRAGLRLMPNSGHATIVLAADLPADSAKLAAIILAIQSRKRGANAAEAVG